MEKQFTAIERAYVDGNATFTVFHPAIKFKKDEEFCFFPDEETRTGLLEYEDEDNALFNAEQLYKHYVLSKR